MLLGISSRWCTVGADYLLTCTMQLSFMFVHPPYGLPGISPCKRVCRCWQLIGASTVHQQPLCIEL